MFGFYYCEIETPLDNYLGVLPFRSKTGLTFPLGKWKGWYFSEELKFAVNECGYKIKVLKGYSFNREKDVFKDYIDNVYKHKVNPINKTQKAMAKNLLNNLLGRFGIKMEKPLTKIVNNDIFNRISLMHKITSYTPIGDKKMLVSYNPILEPEIIESHGLDFTKISSKYPDKEIQTRSNTSVVISAAITAYARIHIFKI